MKRVVHFLFIVVLALTYLRVSAQDFKIAPKTILHDGSYNYNVNVTSDINNGFLVTWVNYYKVGSTVYYDNYACRISKTGQMLDSTAILLSDLGWHMFCSSAVFAGGNWITLTTQGALYEWIGAVRLTPSGVVLDSNPVNVMQCLGMASPIYPVLATNGQKVLCLCGMAGDSLFASIFDPDLNILVKRFGVFPKTGNGGFYRVVSNGENFYITFTSSNSESPGIKLIIINPQGKILSTQTVIEKFSYNNHYGVPAITVVDNIIYISYFNESKLYLRRYNMEGNPIDVNSIKICEFQDFDPILDLITLNIQVKAYMDMVFANESFFLFWPKTPVQGMSMINFESDFLTHEIQTLNSQCQFAAGDYMTEESDVIIRASTIDNKVMSAWIDGRDGNMRVYGKLIDVSYKLRINATNGTVTQNPDRSIYDYMEQVILTATPSTGYHFVNWSGDITGTQNPITVTMDANKTITANFAVNTYTLNVNTTNGTVARNPDQANYNYMAQVILTAAPSTGYHFVNWSGDITGTQNPVIVTMNGNKSITSNFAINTYTLTVNSTNGDVARNPNQINYNYLTQVILTAVPSTGYHFVNWSGDKSGTQNPVTVTMDGNKTITANFSINKYTLTVNAVNGTVTRNPDQPSYDYMTHVQLTGIPSPGYDQVYWTGDAAGTQNPLTVTMDGNKTITANFHTIGINNIEETSFKVYPNPFEDYLILEINDFAESTGDLRYMLLDVNGRLIKEDKIDRKVNVVNVSNLNSSTYFISIFSKTRKLQTIKVEKQ